jgi:Tfp pilus assembly protein PilN
MIMIQVNLLPPEYRKTESTPLPRLLAIIGGVTLCACAIGIFLYVHFGVLKQYVAKREQKEEIYYKQKELADRSLMLQRELNEYKKRRTTIESILQKRLLVSKKLDEFWDIVHNNGDHKKHFVWLTQITAKVGSNAKKGRGAGSGGSLSFKGYSASEDFSKLANFRDDIQSSDVEGGFFEDFMRIDPPSWVVTRWTDGLVPEAAGTFSHTMTLKPLGWRLNPKFQKRRK